MITYEVHVCIGQDDPEKRIAVKCHDTGVNLMVFPEVCHQGRWRDFTEPYRIPAGSTAVIKIAKPDKTYCVCEGELVNGGIFFKLPSQSFTAAGVALAEVSIFGQDSRRLTSATFDIHVPEECVCGSTEDSKSYVDVMAEQIKTAVDAAEIATEKAQKVEEAVAHSPIISDAGMWLVWDSDKGEYVDTGVSASGSTQPDWSQNDEVAKDFIKNRPIINGTGTKVIFDGSIEITSDSPQSVSFTQKLNSYVPLEAGKTYLISVNGAAPIERTCTQELKLNIWNILCMYNDGDATYVKGFRYDPPSLLKIELPIGSKTLISPKVIQDMYYCDEVEEYVSTGVGSAGFLELGIPDIIPKVVVKGETYENVLGEFKEYHMYYTFGSYTLDYWFGSISDTTGGAESNDFEFFKKVKTEKVHTIPEKYLPGSSSSLLTVTISEVVDSSGITYSADRTFAEIMAAIEANRAVQATFDGVIFPLMGFFSEGVIFEIAISVPPLFAYFDRFRISSSNIIDRSQMEVPNTDLGISSAKAGQFVRIKTVTGYGSPVQFEAADAPSGAKGDKGDTGPQGPAGKDGAGMDVTGAAVGQIAKISAVDDNGVPTAWDPVDMPSGGGKMRWQKINSLTLTEQTNDIVIDKDTAGVAISEYAAIALKITLDVPADESQTNANGDLWAYPSATTTDTSIRVIGTISGWKTTRRKMAMIFFGDSNSVTAAGSVAAALVPAAGISLMGGARLYINNATDHWPIGTYVSVEVLSDREATA